MTMDVKQESPDFIAGKQAERQRVLALLKKHQDAARNGHEMMAMMRVKWIRDAIRAEDHWEGEP